MNVVKLSGLNLYKELLCHVLRLSGNRRSGFISTVVASGCLRRLCSRLFMDAINRFKIL
jgi:hypothetical protein